jgi:thioredoxin-related protein
MKSLKLFIIIGVLSLSVYNSMAQVVKWYTFQEAVTLNQKAPRKIIIDVYTDWCGWCKVMDKETFQNPLISKILTEKYYPVKFNAESKESVTFEGHTFINDGQGSRPVHQLAVALLNGKLSYPSIVFMNEKNQLITAVPGFQKPEQMEPLLIYIWNSLYEKNIDFQQYSNSFKSGSQQ